MFNFKELFAGIVLVFLLGVVGFLYRLSIDSSYKGVSVCSFDTKTCPDGSFVGKIGPICSFSPCLPPNVELLSGESFVLPTGYLSVATSTFNDKYIIAAYEKTVKGVASTTQDIIKISKYIVPNSGIADAAILKNTVYIQSKKHPNSINDFFEIKIEGNIFYKIGLGKVSSTTYESYFTVNKKTIYRFDWIGEVSGSQTGTTSYKISKDIGRLLSTFKF